MKQQASKQMWWQPLRRMYSGMHSTLTACGPLCLRGFGQHIHNHWGTGTTAPSPRTR